jgi:hypothetical protein
MDLQADEGLSNAGASPASAEAKQQEATAPAIDVEKLADKVYRLMHEELRLCRVRGQGRSRYSGG